MITIRLNVTHNDENFINIINQFNNVVRYSYNRFKESCLYKDIYEMCKSLNNISALDSYWIKNAIDSSLEIYNKNPDGIIFGGKKNFVNRKYNKITKEEWNKLRNIPLYCCGSVENKGNRKFKIDLLRNEVILKINKKYNIYLKIKNKLSNNHLHLLKALEIACVEGVSKFSAKFDGNTVLISFDENIVKDIYYKPVKNRILSIDQNPNYTGIVICDYDSHNTQKILYKEIISVKQIKGYSKAKYEMFQITNYIKNLAKRYLCECVAVEKLNITSKNHNKGKRYNKLINNWNRVDFCNNLNKWCNIIGIKLLKIVPEYSSFIGCINNPDDYDMIAAAIEIGRRANLFNRIYIRKDMEKSNILFPAVDYSHLATRWKEMLNDNINESITWKGLYDFCKKTKKNYRLSVDNQQFFRMKSDKSEVDKFLPKLLSHEI